MTDDCDAVTDSTSGRVDMLRDIFARQAELAGFYHEVRPTGFYSLPPLERCTTWTRAIVHECCELAYVIWNLRLCGEQMIVIHCLPIERLYQGLRPVHGNVGPVSAH